MRESTGILVMAYGSPAGDDDVEPYLTHIRGGRPPSAEAVAELRARYRAAGGSPLTRITRAQAEALARRLDMPVFVGMKHASPFIADGAAAAAKAGVERLIGLPLAPHHAEMSVGAYHETLRNAWRGDLVQVRGFHDHPAFIAAVGVLLNEALTAFAPDLTIFTAHSLPARIEAEGDPYRERLLESCRLAARAAGLRRWEFAFQSASHTGERWLGPDLLEVLVLHRKRRVLVCPIGFVADHLEVLYDIDVEAIAFARERGIELVRTASFNDRPELMDALAEIVRGAVRRADAAPIIRA